MVSGSESDPAAVRVSALRAGSACHTHLVPACLRSLWPTMAIRSSQGASPSRVPAYGWTGGCVLAVVGCLGEHLGPLARPPPLFRVHYPGFGPLEAGLLPRTESRPAITRLPPRPLAPSSVGPAVTGASAFVAAWIAAAAGSSGGSASA